MTEPSELQDVVLNPRMPRWVKVIGILAFLVVAGTCAGAMFWNASDANSQGQPIYGTSCFVGHLLARDSSALPKFIVQAVGPPEIHGDSVQVPIAPLVLVCTRFPAAGVVKPSTSALRLRP